jgi:hypothetical protein
MYCSQCATPLTESDVYCPNCSKPVASFHTGGRVAQVEPLGETPTVVHPRPGEQRKATVPAAMVGAIAGSVFTVAIGGLLLLLYLQSNRKQPDANIAVANAIANTPANAVPTPTITATPTPVPTPTPNPKVEIVNTRFEVPARKEQIFDFTVSSPAHVTGGFVAYGGSNDIAAELTDDSGRAYYQTDYTNKGKINVKVPRGHYTLVFSNRRAWFTDKSVAAEIYYQEQ